MSVKVLKIYMTLQKLIYEITSGISSNIKSIIKIGSEFAANLLTNLLFGISEEFSLVHQVDLFLYVSVKK